MSRPSNSEKYVVCLDFVFNDSDSDFKNMIKKLDKIHQLSHKNIKLNLVDLFPDYEPEKNLLDYVIYTNVEIANNQFKSLNEIVEFINSQNYYGDIYQMKRDLQIFANKYWINRFYPDPQNFIPTIEKIRDEINSLIKNTDITVSDKMKNF